MNRRNFVKETAGLGLALSAAQLRAQNETLAQAQQAGGASATALWPNGARMVISLSLQMEAGAQPDRGANGPWGQLDTRYPDLTTEKWYEYGIKEGIPRLLDMFDRKRVKVTSHMVGQAVDKNPAVAKEIVQRGHEPAAHGQNWSPIYDKTPEQERASFQVNVASIERATGQKPVGFNAPGMRGTPNTLGILQDLGFIYYTDDLSRDEPFLIPVNQKPFVVVPYTFQLNDLQNYENRWHTCAEFASELRAEFDALYEESAVKRRMMSISSHDRVAGRASRTKVLEDFISYAQTKPGVVFLRKDEIARFALSSPMTIREGQFA